MDAATSAATESGAGRMAMFLVNLKWERVGVCERTVDRRPSVTRARRLPPALLFMSLPDEEAEMLWDGGSGMVYTGALMPCTKGSHRSKKTSVYSQSDTPCPTQSLEGHVVG